LKLRTMYRVVTAKTNFVPNNYSNPQCPNMLPIVSCTNETCGLFPFLFVQKLGNICYKQRANITLTFEQRLQNNPYHGEHNGPVLLTYEQYRVRGLFPVIYLCVLVWPGRFFSPQHLSIRCYKGLLKKGSGTLPIGQHWLE